MTFDSGNGGVGLPLEFRIPLGAVVDPGGAAPSVLTPPPAPNAVVGASPGLATGAAAPPVGPTLPDPSDPAGMQILFAKLAGELLGSSAVPAPSPQQVMTGTGITAASPGISPTLVPGPTTPGLDPTSPASSALIQNPAAPVSGVGVSPPGFGGGIPGQTPTLPSSPGSPGGLTPPGGSPMAATGGRSTESKTQSEWRESLQSSPSQG